GVDLRIGGGRQAEAGVELLGERAARPLAEQSDAGPDVDPRLVVRLRPPVLADAAIPRAYAGDPVALHQQLSAGKLAEDVDAERLGLLRHPLDQPAERGDVAAVILHRRRLGQRAGALPGEPP